MTDQTDLPDEPVHGSNGKVSFTIEVDPEIAALLEKLQVEYAASSKGRVVEMLLRDLIFGEDSESGE